MANLNGLFHSLEYGGEDEDIFGLLLAGPAGHRAEVTHKPKRFEELCRTGRICLSYFKGIWVSIISFIHLLCSMC